MSLTKYQSPASLEARFIQNLGRSTKKVNLRQGIHNPVLDAVMRAQGKLSPNRANALLQARSGLNAPSKSRSFFPYLPLLGAGTWAEDANALPLDAFKSFSDIDWSHPGFALGMGSAVIAMQGYAMMQRHQILKNLNPVANCVEQGDLNDEILELEAPLDSEVIKSPWDVDVATRQGKVRSENQDAIAGLEFSDGSHAIILCDGAGGIKGGKEASHSAVEAIKDYLTGCFAEQSTLRPNDLEAAIDAARTTAEDKNLTGLTTALLLLLKEDHVHWATLGDGDVAIIWPDGMVNHVQVPHHTAGAPTNIINAYIGKGCSVPPRIGSQRLEPGAMVLAMSDGASDLFPYQELALVREQITSLDGIANSYLKDLESARDPDTGAYLHNDNMSLAFAGLTTGGDDAK